jgi:citrate lyase beta subunit
MEVAAELRCRNVWEPPLVARCRNVHAAAGAGLDPIEVPRLDLEDSDGMRTEAERAGAPGFPARAQCASGRSTA